MELMTALINNESASNEKEALEIMTEMRNRVLDGENPDDVLGDYGLEPDYIFDILD